MSEEMSEILRGNTTFFIVNNISKRSIESIEEYRKEWIKTNNLSITQHFQYSNEVSSIFYNKDLIYQKTDTNSHEFISNTIGSFYEQFSKVYEKEPQDEVDDEDEEEDIDEIMEEEEYDENYDDENYYDDEYYEEYEEEYDDY